MKSYTISAQTFFSAVKHQWKAFLVTVLAFAVLGGVCGWLFAGRGSSEVGGGANPLPRANLDTVARTPVYFSDCLAAIMDRYKMLDSYSNVGSFVNTLPKEQADPLQKRLAALNKEKREFQQFILVPLQNELGGSDALYIPEEFLVDIAARYERQLTSIEFDLLAAETAAETIRQMDAPYFDNDIVTGNYANLIQQAATYGNLLRSRAVLEESLRRLRDEPELIRFESRRTEQELNKAAAELNALLDEASQLAEEVGKAADLSFSLSSNTASSYGLVTKHTYRAASLAESFAAIELFCVLIGICVGGFLAACREAKAQKDTAGKPSEHQHTVEEE